MTLPPYAQGSCSGVIGDPEATEFMGTQEGWSLNRDFILALFAASDDGPGVPPSRDDDLVQSRRASTGGTEGDVDVMAGPDAKLYPLGIDMARQEAVFVVSVGRHEDTRLAFCI